ncbi:MAG: hypothetical protein K2I26_04180 [Paramuribaculum sp.]|nr:hypothetical protein [Paramuribaculum sp.]
MKKFFVFLFCVAVSMTSVAQAWRIVKGFGKMPRTERISIAVLKGTAQINRSLTNLNNNSNLTVPSVTRSSVLFKQVKASKDLLNKTKSSQKKENDPKLRMESLMRMLKDSQKQDQIYKDALEAGQDINCLQTNDDVLQDQSHE